MKYSALAVFALLGCQATQNSASIDTACPTCEQREAQTERNEAARKHLLDSVAALEGRWWMEGEEGHDYIEFEVTSGGSVVRERMFPGQPHEMTNMYSLDGNVLVMTHYCGAGNQPHMRARELGDGSLAFEAFAVGDLASPDSLYMGSMTLVFVDEDNVVENWSATTAGETSEMAQFKLTRVH
jgi:hypothetical protein